MLHKMGWDRGTKQKTKQSRLLVSPIEEAAVSLQSTSVWQDIFSLTKEDHRIAKGCQPSNVSKERYRYLRVRTANVKLDFKEQTSDKCIQYAKLAAIPDFLCIYLLIQYIAFI